MRKLIATIAAGLMILCFAHAAETNIIVHTVLVKMLCKCGGEMKPANYTLMSDPPMYPHLCNKCGASANYTNSYPFIRFVWEGK